jgi:hypothetical protein
MRRSWRKPNGEPAADRPETEVERLQRDLLAERRKVVERDIEIAELRAQLEAGEPSADG